MYEVEPLVGRLALVRWRGPVGMDELIPFLGQVRNLVASAPARVVFCSDYRGSDPFPPAALDAIVWSVMRQDNPRLECSAFLVDPNNRALRAQFEAMFAQGGHPGRRLFTSAGPLLSWLAPRLDARETERLQAFLGRERSDRPLPPTSNRTGEK
jgi:hypothetical protein